MKVDLDKVALISLVKGEDPYFNIMHLPGINNAGSFYNEIWHWDDSYLNSLNEEMLFEIYKLCRNSWKHNSKMK